ncbi:hypothetical protein EMIHUDRAFT_228046 [Emiliania huxleyi CCMP1516]|uniref:GH16 domain-containing protein n=2 Tax=Emiliania huxleyi TaxID=2903 RepID=A0A0D3KGW9_EMIH1|nr:hypothetical protein EMIHUDRAFT_228046 [Emiliania huxleyi CCMP1516]EOD35004.1 hypothetical protein EMIHUDRAFT_228046 [Emiliania huxleyi CCMP1516]|eukprot:XP_005787433.1 hypothetical protein EMIHUDRAFT_228046 [Emiliania huxleyi CCMP1516]
MFGIGVNKDNTLNNGVSAAFRRENLSVRDGKLVMTAKQEAPPLAGPSEPRLDSVDFHYSSGAVHTSLGYPLRNNMYLEVRLKLPDNAGGFCALWAMPNNPFGTPADLFEIDIFEFHANREQTKFYSGIWWHDFERDEQPEDLLGYRARAEDHIFVTQQEYRGHFPGHSAHFQGGSVDYYEFLTVGLKVSAGKIEWFLAQDGPAWRSLPYRTFSGGTVRARGNHNCERYGGHCNASHLEWQRDVPSNLDARVILEYTLRDPLWAGGPINNSDLPSEMLVDYIRFYDLPELDPLISDSKLPLPSDSKLPLPPSAPAGFTSHTPHIDTLLASEGMTLTDTHATPWCGPSRYSILSGRYPQRGRHPVGTYEPEPDCSNQFLDGQASLAQVLRAANFDTAFFGGCRGYPSLGHAATL